MDDECIQYKILFLGPSRAGKSCLVNRIVDNVFCEE